MHAACGVDRWLKALLRALLALRETAGATARVAAFVRQAFLIQLAPRLHFLMLGALQPQLLHIGIRTYFGIGKLSVFFHKYAYRHSDDT